MNVVAIFVGSFLLAVTATAIVAMLRIRGRATFFVAGLVAAAATIVAVVELLSLFDALTRPALLLAQLVVAGIAAGAWHSTGRPRPAAIPRPTLRALVETARTHPAVTLLAVLVALALVIELVLAVTVAPSNWDSMTYHLSRAAYWLQHHSATQWAGGSIRQLDSPPNAEMLVAWTMSLRGSDQLASLVQWTALTGIAVAVFSICRLIAFPIAASVFAAGLFAAMPQPILQATTTQNDLVTTLFITSALLFGIRSLRDRSLGDATIASVSLGLAIGTKGTALIAMPSIALVVGYAWWRYRPPRRFVTKVFGIALASVVAFGAFNYVQTLRTTGTLFGPIKQLVERTSPIGGNVGRVAWTFADSPQTSVPGLDLVLQRLSRRVFGDLEHPRFELAIRTSSQEDTAAFGLVGLLVLLPIIVVTVVRPRAPPWRRIFALAGLGYIVAFAIANEWNPWIARVLVPGVAMAAPLLACVALRPWLSGVTVALAIAGLVPSALMNEQKPLLVPRGAKTVYALDRLRQQTIVRTEMAGVITAVNANVDRKAALGFVGSEDSWDYPLFGRHLERWVVRLTAGEVTAPFMAAAGLAGVLFANAGPPPAPLVFHRVGDEYYLVLARDQRYGQSVEKDVKATTP